MMNLKGILFPLLAVGLLLASYDRYGWQGVAVISGGLVMWLLLHVTRMMTVFKRASARPVGYVDSAVMLNAKLEKGVNLLHVMALTRSLGETLPSENAHSERYRWTDNAQSSVTLEFVKGKLAQWSLHRQPSLEEDAGEEMAYGVEKSE